LLAAALLWAGAPIWLAILLALLGTAASFVLLRRYYGRLGSHAPEAAAEDVGRLMSKAPPGPL
jgi:membrane protein implicated in regulation of membrane protease activity